MITDNWVYEIDFTDAELIEKIDEGVKKIDEEIKELEKVKNDISPAEGIRQECKILKEFLDYVFGEGKSKEVFGDKDSLKECLKIYEDIIKERNRQYDNLQNVVDTYSPDRLKR